LDSGPIGSLAVGIDIINHMVDGVLVWPVDQPSVASETLRRLVNGFRTSQASIVVPTHDGRRGHPVLIRAALFAEIPRAVKAGRTLRDVIRSEPTSVFEVAADDAAILQDIDTPMDYEALRRRITD
jgi:molybdenum cofactor cytidylyltransferase